MRYRLAILVAAAFLAIGWSLGLLFSAWAEKRPYRFQVSTYTVYQNDDATVSDTIYTPTKIFQTREEADVEAAYINARFTSIAVESAKMGAEMKPVHIVVNVEKIR